MKYYEYMNSPIGILKIYANEDAIVKLEILKGQKPSSEDLDSIIKVKAGIGEDDKLYTSIITVSRAKDELLRYFDGKLQNFSVKINPEGTYFQKSVWSELLNIPYGRTICYQELADKIGKPKACRAVGNANGKNPIPIIIPCHRVIAKNGGLGGYSSGPDIKKVLLSTENIILPSSK